MRGMEKTLLIICFLFLSSGCATTASETAGGLGSSSGRNVVILGEHISPEEAQKFADKYEAIVLFGPSRNILSDAVSTSMRGAVGPSRVMRDLIVELKSLNYTSGEWSLIIPAQAERYFLVLLRNMEDGALSNAKGIILFESASRSASLDTEVKRVFGSGFRMEINGINKR